MMTGYGMGFSGFGFIFVALFWIVIIGLGIWLLSKIFPQDHETHSADGESAMDILKQRYAHGELSKEEYETMRADLER